MNPELGHMILASSSDSGDNTAIIGLALYLSGFLFFLWVYLRYRNVDKRYHYEKKTQVALRNMKHRDEFIRAKNNQNSPTMSGANNTKVYGAQNGWSKFSSLLDTTGATSILKRFGGS